MGTLTGNQLVTRIRKVLQDTTAGGTRWLDAELLDWINDSQREIVLLKPNAYSTVTTLTLVEGTKQTLPATGLLLLDITRNVGGPAVRRVDRHILDSENAAWHTASADATVLHYVFNPDSPDTFWVYPPQPSSGFGSIELTYSEAPSDLSTLGDTITLNDIYANVIVDYVLYRAYSKDADFAANAQRAATHYQAFNNALGVRTQIDVAADPNNDPQPRFRGVG